MNDLRRINYIGHDYVQEICNVLHVCGRYHDGTWAKSVVIDAELLRGMFTQTAKYREEYDLAILRAERAEQERDHWKQAAVALDRFP